MEPQRSGPPASAQVDVESELVAAVLDALPNIAFIKDEQHRCLFVNARWCEFCGLRLEDVLGKTDHEFTEKAQADVFCAIDDIVFSTGKTWENEEQFTSAGGEVHTFITRKSLHVDRHGRRVLLGVSTDVTQRRAAEKALLRARDDQFELLRRAMRTIGHEVNNSLAPVRSVLRSARQLLRRPDAAQKLEAVLDLIAERTEHLRAFLDAYAQLARLPPPIKKPVSWQPFLDELALLYPFRLRGPPPAQPACFDRAQMQQVLINLLKNARESGSPPDQVEVEVGMSGDAQVSIAVLDRGPGMKAEDLAHAAEPFFTTKPKGSGLGLHLCREVARAHGGTLQLRARQGGGVEARLQIPV